MAYQDPGGKKPEKLYHGFIMGLLVSLESAYTVRSNRESGFGRADLLVIPRQPGRPGVVLELKVLHRDFGETVEKALVSAVEQIVARGYATELEVAGARRVHQWGVVLRRQTGVGEGGLERGWVRPETGRVVSTPKWTRRLAVSEIHRHRIETRIKESR